MGFKGFVNSRKRFIERSTKSKQNSRVHSMSCEVLSLINAGQRKNKVVKFTPLMRGEENWKTAEI